MVDKEKFLRFLFLLTILLPFIILFSWPEQKLELIACNVGQGDAILLTKGFTQIMIDAGPNDKILDCLEEARAEGKIMDKESALKMAQELIEIAEKL